VLGIDGRGTCVWLLAGQQAPAVGKCWAVSGLQGLGLRRARGLGGYPCHQLTAGFEKAPCSKSFGLSTQQEARVNKRREIHWR